MAIIDGEMVEKKADRTVPSNNRKSSRHRPKIAFLFRDNPNQKRILNQSYDL